MISRFWVKVVTLMVAPAVEAAPGRIEGVHVPLRSVSCAGMTHDEYTLGDRVLPGKPLLRDLFSGRATLAPIGSSRDHADITLRFTTKDVIAFDEKVPIFRVPGRRGHYAFVRGIRHDYWSIYLMRSVDGGLTFEETPGETRDATSGDLTRWNNDPVLYDNQIDPTIVVDHDTCPPTYRMTAECSHVPTGRVDVCESHTQTPLDLKSWSKMAPLVSGDNRFHSGSTGAMLLDVRRDGADGAWVTRRYVKWTDVQNTDRRVTTVVVRNDGLTLLGRAGAVGLTVLDAEVYPCRGEWDCNNRDGQDWKREGDQYFLPYNGGNYHGCDRPADGSPNLWGLSFARSIGSPLGRYERLPEPLILARRNDVCGISYPYVNVIDGEIWVYFAYYAAGGPAPGKSHTVRSRLVFR